MDAKQSHKKMAAEVLQFIDQNDNFLLSAHINADGDAIASVIAMALLLEKRNKKAEMIFHDQSIDSRFNYLKYFKNIRSYNQEMEKNYEAAIILDVPGLKRLGDVANLLPPRSNVAKIDHHPVEGDFAICNMVDEHASSTTQLIYEILELSGIPVDVDLANAIYTGIVYDTGRFSFSNTTSRDMYIGGYMIEIGIDPAQINNRIFFENSYLFPKYGDLSKSRFT